MSYFAKNATEESLKKIANQMEIDNRFKIIKELYNAGDITREEYVRDLYALCKSI